MRNIGRTNNGDYLVEMTLEEAREFEKLSIAVDGKTSEHIFMNPIDYSRGIDYNLSTTFGVIRAWYISKFRVNEMQSSLDEIKKVLNG